MMLSQENKILTSAISNSLGRIGDQRFLGLELKASLITCQTLPFCRFKVPTDKGNL